jgi:hypothetical protein
MVFDIPNPGRGPVATQAHRPGHLHALRQLTSCHVYLSYYEYLGQRLVTWRHQREEHLSLALANACLLEPAVSPVYTQTWIPPAHT